ncbi:MAG: hypothetical protein ACO3ND_07980 [Opitutales bacterium]
MSAAYCAVCGETYTKSGTRRTCGHPRCVRTWARHRRTILAGTDQTVAKVREFLEVGFPMTEAVDRVARIQELRRAEVISRWQAVEGARA